MPAPFAAAVPVTSEGVLEPEDRFELLPTAAGLLLPEVLRVNQAPIDLLEDETGQPLRFTVQPEEGHLRLPETVRTQAAAAAAVWLVYQERGRFRLVLEAAPPAGPQAMTTEQGIPLQFDPDDWSLVRGPRPAPVNLPEFDLALRAARLTSHAGFDQLICLPLVRDMELLEHQIRTAKTVLRRCRGRALLCDEVGLGKTIEAGLVLDELHLRGLARSTLILVPPSLIEQWQGEMRRKFGLDFTSHDDPAFRQRGSAAWNEFDRVIVSLHTAKREPHRSAILGRKWDM